MDSIFKKLNILIKATISDLASSALVAGRIAKTSDGAIHNLDGEIRILRQRLEEAFDYENKLLLHVQQLGDRVAEWDAKADAAVEAGRDADARYAIARMQHYQQQLTMAEADLDDHRRVTQELLHNINRLEAIVSQAKEAAREKQQGEDSAEEVSLTTRWSDFIRTAQNRLSDILTIRSNLDVPTVMDNETIDTSDNDIDDDLDQRRARLSKPGT